MQETENENEGSIDGSLVEWMLSLSYEERIEAHESARRLAEDLAQAGKNFRENRPQITP